MHISSIVVRLVICVLLLASTVVGGVVTADAKNDYEIINTGINGGGCWYDDSHFIVVKGRQTAPGQEFEVEGLYYLNPNKPKSLVRIDLSPVDPNLQKHIRDVTCQEQTILFHVLAPDNKRNTLYALKIGQRPSILAEKTKGFAVPQYVSVQDKYALSFSLALRKREAPYSTSPEQARQDCQFSHVQEGYRVACLRPDRGTKQLWLVKKGFLVKYIWDETIREGADGAYKWVPNSEPPLLLPDGSELKQGYLLRDLENRIVTQVKMEQPPYQIYRNTITPDPQGEYLYAACSKAGDHGVRPLTVGGRICRFQLDGANQRWTEVAAVQQSPQDPLSLQYLNINQGGDVVVLEPAHGGSSIFWKYSATTHRVEQVRHAPTTADLGVPRLSPSGRWISFLERQTLYFAQDKGVHP